MVKFISSQRRVCCICKKPKEKFNLPLCKECSPYIYKKQGYPHQKLRRRKIWVEKRSQKLQEVNNICEWCGATKPPLSIHHSEEVNSRTYEYLWNKLVKGKITEFLNNNPERLEFAKTFLKWKRRIELKNNKKFFEAHAKEGSKKLPAYITQKLKSIQVQLDKIKEPSNPSLNKLMQNENTSWELIAKILPLFYSGIKEEYERNVQELLEGYFDFKKTIVLCRKCHNAVRLGLELCKICKKNYHKEMYDMCYTCYKKYGEEDYFAYDEDFDEDFFDKYE